MNKDKEILLRKAKQLYPIGAKVIGLGSGEEVIIDSDHEFSNYDRIAVKIVSDYPIDIDFIYDSGKWAEVLEYPAEYTIRPYWQLYTAQQDVAMWAPSGSDSLAEDWTIID